MPLKKVINGVQFPLQQLQEHFSISDQFVFRETIAYILVFLFHFLVYFEKSLTCSFLLRLNLYMVELKKCLGPSE